MADPASIRTNNPGAQWFGPMAQAFGATGAQNLPGGNNAATFPDPVSGAAAQFALWNKHYTGMPLSAAINKWSGGNSPQGYTDFLTRNAGLAPDTMVTPGMLAGPQGIALAKAQAQWEAGKPYPMSDDQWVDAQTRGLAPLSNPNTRSSMPNAMNSAIAQSGNPMQQATDPNAQQSPNWDAVGPALQRAGIGLMSINNPSALGGLSAINQQQMLNKPVWGVISKDLFGNEKYGWINANSQTVTPASGGGGGAGSPSSDLSTDDISKAIANIQNKREGGTSIEDLYKEVPVAMQGYVKAMVEGQALPVNLARQGNMRNLSMMVAHEIDPTFDETSLVRRTQYQKELGQSGAQTNGGQIALVGTSLGHLADAAKAADALGNTDGFGWAPLARIINWGKNTTTENAAKANALNEAVDKFAGETGKLYSGAQGGGVSEREMVRGRLGDTKSASELASAMEMSSQLIQAKIASQESLRQQAMGNAAANLNPILGAKQQNDIQTIQNVIAKLRSGQAAPASIPANRPPLSSIFQ